MRCDELVNEIILYYAGELSEQKTEEYKRHTMICTQCARYSFAIRKSIKFVEDNVPKITKIDLLSD
ncbi:MAG: hypothetical protein LBV16_07105 [Elusimicrobiota bacterium]|nr:hypothetical protein [Elusimicrobiota bacterium]